MIFAEQVKKQLLSLIGEMTLRLIKSIEQMIMRFVHVVRGPERQNK